jgi:hypothetical protein
VEFAEQHCGQLSNVHPFRCRLDGFIYLAQSCSLR